MNLLEYALQVYGLGPSMRGMELAFTKLTVLEDRMAEITEEADVRHFHYDSHPHFAPGTSNEIQEEYLRLEREKPVFEADLRRFKSRMMRGILANIGDKPGQHFEFTPDHDGILNVQVGYSNISVLIEDGPNHVNVSVWNRVSDDDAHKMDEIDVKKGGKREP